MSTADDIKKMTQKFVTEKGQDYLKKMDLESLAQTWSTAKETPDFEAQSQQMAEKINDEILQNKIDEYMTSLQYGRFSPADFPKISEFCEEFGFKMANTDLKNKITSLQETMESCRLNMPNEVNIKFDDKLKADFSPLPHLEKVSINGNVEVLKDLEDKKEIKGKNFSFKDNNNNEIGGVEFDKDNIAHILCPDQDGNVVEYKLSTDNKLSRVNDDNTETALDTSILKNLSTQDIRAYNLGISAQKLWKKYINKELDKNVEKPKLTINEGGKKATKVNEGETEEETPQTTRFDEETSKKKEEADLDNDSDNNVAFPNNDFQWKEDDIIKVMFQDWFLAAANSATNFVLNHIEYAAAGIWHTLEKSYRNSKSQSTPKKEEKPDVTHQFYSEIEGISQKKMNDLKNGQNNQEIIALVKDGKAQDAIVTNDLLRDFGQQAGVDVAALLSKGNPEKTVPLLTSMAALYSSYSDNYARASILDAKMKDVHNFDNINQEDLYAQKRGEAGKILKSMLYEKISNTKNPDFNLFIETIQEANKDMSSALEFGIKDYNKKNYNEHGKEPAENKVLNSYKEHLGKDEPTDLYNFTQQQAQIINNRNFINQGLNMSQAQLNASEHENKLKRQDFLKIKHNILGGIDKKPNMMNVTQEFVTTHTSGGR